MIESKFNCPYCNRPIAVHYDAAFPQSVNQMVHTTLDEPSKTTDIQIEIEVDRFNLAREIARTWLNGRNMKMALVDIDRREAAANAQG